MGRIKAIGNPIPGGIAEAAGPARHVNENRSVDATTLTDRRRRRTRMARFWFYAADDRPWQGLAAPIVVYIFAEGPSGRHVHEHLTGFSGVLQVDGYTGYDELAKPRRSGGAVTLAYCLAHARRQFFEVYRNSKSSVAAEALRRIETVYRIEERVRGLTAAERVIVRQVETRPIVEEFKSWLMQCLAEESAKIPVCSNKSIARSPASSPMAHMTGPDRPGRGEK